MITDTPRTPGSKGAILPGDGVTALARLALPATPEHRHSPCGSRHIWIARNVLNPGVAAAARLASRGCVTRRSERPALSQRGGASSQRTLC